MSTIEVKVPDLGGAPTADVIAINVNVGDTVAVDDALITLEGDKASMDIPSPEAGVVKEIKLSIGDKVSEGSLILVMEKEGGGAETSPSANASTAPSSGEVTGFAARKEDASSSREDQPTSPSSAEHFTSSSRGDQSTSSSPSAEHFTSPLDGEVEALAEGEVGEVDESGIYAGPLVRRIAYEFGVNLTQVHGTARKGRITKEDVQNYVKRRLSSSSAPGISHSPVEEIDFSKWGDIEKKPLNKIKRLTAENMHRAWITVPHVTQFEQADITELEAFREKQKHHAEKEGFKLTPLAFIVKAVTHALKAFPTFNASLDATGENLIFKKYYHIGVAVDTPNGLVVPVLQNVDQQSIQQIAKNMADMGERARNKALLPKDMMGSSFTVSSLGGIGGTAFTPIVNLPNVAILGVSKARIQPVYLNGQFVPRLMLPLSLSYDHRVIDGAEAARFAVYLSSCLEDLKLLLL